jgi:DNA-binding NarL/FixJ family response regulator
MKVLIVEDDDSLRMVYATKLQMEGFEVETAADGAEGFKLAEKSNPGVVLLDLMMPHMSGLDFLRAYDVKNKHKNCKVVVFSNVQDPKSVDETQKLGAVKFLTKASITPNDMVGIVKEVTAGSP